MTYPTFLLKELEDVYHRLGDNGCKIDMSTALLIYSLVLSKKPSYVLEIGRYQGFSTACIVGALNDLCKGELYSIDIKHQCPEWIEYFLSPHHILTMNSLDILKDAKISSLLFDMFFIDGDHTYHGVTKDLENTYSLSNWGAQWLIDDANFSAVDQAITDWLAKNSNLRDLGIFNKKIRIISRVS